MYALVALVPFVLLATVLGLSWWEDRILPPAAPEAAPVMTPVTSTAPRPASTPTPPNGR
ncbi:MULTISPECIES: hypothetical protein [Streptomyces]|uniref:Uncharacterized protein n=1 Tax=Streptomyces lasiicapitis TaxID=1923961 RepID=A0ABQ2LR52_9ACTN|nr:MULTISPECIES: hypothetical protein [Streptomyces]QIB41696.1 hypothetical protein G3H79_35410 [Streptomyces aureoverticillatus]GGO42299.1 hypothetical protein GCM10012286_23520 [Streptomyces lasiicapitis]